MSFDIFVQDIPATVQTVDDIPDDFKPKPIGTRNAIVAAITQQAPAVSFTDPTSGTIDGGTFSIEVNISSEDPVMGFSFHLRGGKEGALLIAAILSKLGLRALTPNTESGLFDLDEALDAFQRWTDYRENLNDGGDARI